jgi:hypothetical protein
VVLERENKFPRRDLPKLDKKVFEITKKQIGEDINVLKKRLEGYDYVSFSDGRHLNHKYKNYLQVYSLEKTGKNVSCCDYSVRSKLIGDYLVFKSYRYFKFVKKEEFDKLININQIFVRKDYFLENIDRFRYFFNNGIIDIINKENTAFVSIPLLKIYKFHKIGYNALNNLNRAGMDKAFQLNFVFNIYSLLWRKRLFFDSYLYKLVFKSIFGGDFFIAKYLISALFSDEIKNRAENIKKNL